jgi:hypothetical protein
LFGSFIKFFIFSINSFNPFGSILILASLNIASTSSPPFFLIFQSLFLNYSINFAFNFFEISSRGKEANKSSPSPPFPFLPAP